MGTTIGKIVSSTSLFIALAAAGCTSSQLHQSLLMHENRRLEDALYAAHAQTVELKRENDLLRNKQDADSIELPMQSDDRVLDENFDLAPPVEMPKVILPEQPGTSGVPEALKGAQIIPLWQPKR